ncbi:MAG TPA: phenylalanine--tRNA ligase subunit alpha [Clostridiaceae bacterium]|nr:phenylalanine--tRNA ligase subunit alpha [Clostridiaceae bacterium]
MKQQLEAIKNQAMEKLARVSSIRELEDLKVAYLGKKGELTGILKQMGTLSPEERPVIGQLANEVRFALEESISQAKDRLIKEERSIRLKNETIDVTMPGKVKSIGRRHPLTIVLDELKDIFLGMGYEIAEGPEIELDYNNFEALNIPKNHPARDTQDTFYISENVVLRTHTSPVQIRHMMSHKPPIRIICPGRVYRSDAVDATHSPVFHQVEGLVVDKNVTMGDLVGTLQAFAKGIFGENTRIRLRPHHFPFTEPSAEVDVSCWGCGGSGCRICKGEGWIEILGAGMVHPNVLRVCGIDPDVYSGFAFGLGIERIAMGKFGIDDMRLLFENDIRFLRQF